MNKIQQKHYINLMKAQTKGLPPNTCKISMVDILKEIKDSHICLYSQHLRDGNTWIKRSRVQDQSEQHKSLSQNNNNKTIKIKLFLNNIKGNLKCNLLTMLLKVKQNYQGSFENLYF